jgi:hypothetical protein
MTNSFSIDLSFYYHCNSVNTITVIKSRHLFQNMHVTFHKSHNKLLFHFIHKLPSLMTCCVYTGVLALNQELASSYNQVTRFMELIICSVLLYLPSSLFDPTMHVDYFFLSLWSQIPLLIAYALVLPQYRLFNRHPEFSVHN